MFVFELSTAIDLNLHRDTYSRQFPLRCFVPSSVQRRYPFSLSVCIVLMVPSSVQRSYFDSVFLVPN
jgi:hypothetical protein